MADNFLTQIKSNLSMIKQYMWINAKTAIEYKTSFLIQTITMFLNDLLWITFWWLFFTRFPLINDWTYNDLLLLWAFGTIGFGLSGMLFGNKVNIPELIAEGKMDYYLTLPKNVLLHTLVSKVNWFACGDLIFGIVIGILIIKPEQVFLAMFLMIFSTTLFVGFGIISGSLAFFIGNSQKISKTMHDSVLALSIYPTNVYDGIVKLILFTVIPAGLVTGMPVELIRNFEMEKLIWMIVITIIFVIIAILIFYAGLKKYESGNQLYVNA
jgi:ABC-2 type transport system permease protein